MGRAIGPSSLAGFAEKAVATPMTDPTPAERADFVVRKLEQFILDGRTAEHGMSFRTWQAMAREELGNAFADIELRQLKRGADITVRRILAVGATTLVTIGFWGAVMAVDRRYGAVASILLAVAGLVVAALALELGLRRAMNQIQRQRRKAAIGRIENFDRQLKQFEAELKRKTEKAKAKAAEPP
jgi:hypothetical protein